MDRDVNKDKIEKQAKEVLDKFAKALEKVEKEGDVDFWVEREDFMRPEGEGKKINPDFKKRFLKNSPNHDDNFIIAEKGAWK
jgi:predicted Asp-tRNA(Asn)/Glu-tRNA(Gln) amidotransferase subunit C